MGTLILHKETDAQGNDIYNIVDGQQRTITFALLLLALYEDTKDTYNLIFLEQKVFNNPYARHNIPNNLNAFRRRTQKNAEVDEAAEFKREMMRLRDFIENQCELIVVITDDVSEAFQFFDSQNARGKALYPHDLLKAFHLREMADMDEAKVEQIVKFKGVTKSARTPYAQFYKSAFSYANMVNSSAMPFVSGTREVNAFQLNTL